MKCSVPECLSTTNSEKIFFYLPSARRRRNLWLKAIGIKLKDVNGVPVKAGVCEDHFELAKDLKNYMRFRYYPGAKQNVHIGLLKKDVVPHIFKCRSNNEVSHEIELKVLSPEFEKHRCRFVNLIKTEEQNSESDAEISEETESTTSTDTIIFNAVNNIRIEQNEPTLNHVVRREPCIDDFSKNIIYASPHSVFINQQPQTRTDWDIACSKNQLTVDQIKKKEHKKTKPKSTPVIEVLENHCKYCNKKFNSKCTLQSHITSSSLTGMYECKQCHFKSIYKCAIQIHLRIHSDQGAFLCRYCRYRSVSPKILSQHLKELHPETLFRCTYCNYKCSYPYTFLKHLKIRHADESLVLHECLCT